MESSAKKRYLPPGFTLVEIMIAMVIALIVMGGVYQTLSEESINHERSEKILDMQNNARVAMDRIINDVRSAGYMGCGGELGAKVLDGLGNDATLIGRLTIDHVAVGGLARNNMNNNIGTILSQLTSAVTDLDYLGANLGFHDNAAADHPDYQEGTDALTLVYMADEQLLTAIMADGKDDITVASTARFADGDILYVSDCRNYSLFQKTGGTDTTVEHALAGLNISDDLVIRYGATPARLFKLNTSTYFIEKDNFTLAHNNNSRAIASNIEDLQFEFLFDEDGDNDLTDEVWVTNLGAHTSKEVRAIRIWLLAVSDTDFTYTDNNTYVYPNSPYAANSPAALAPITSPADGEHRHRYLTSAVILLRNAGLL